MTRAVIVELLHLCVGLIATGLMFAAAAWSYPHGAETIWAVGYVALIAVAAMCLYEIRRAWKRGRQMRDD